MNESKNTVQYGSILSKISNKKTKNKIFKYTKENLNIQTIEQLKCLSAINILPKPMITKANSVIC